MSVLYISILYVRNPKSMSFQTGEVPGLPGHPVSMSRSVRRHPLSVVNIPQNCRITVSGQYPENQSVRRTDSNSNNRICNESNINGNYSNNEIMMTWELLWRPL